MIYFPSSTPLMYAASDGTRECMELILATGEIDINQQDTNGRSALHFACKAGKLENVRYLLSLQGINYELRTVGGMTPLMSAAESGKILVIAECLNRGLNPF